MKRINILALSFVLFASIVYVKSASAGSFGVMDFPGKVCAPYVECWNDLSVASLATSTGSKYFTLAFVISNSTANSAPYWDGTMPMSDNKYVSDIAGLRAGGGDVIISFGGSGGSELAQEYTSASALQAAYQQVITKYSLKWMDLDIEGAFVADAVHINVRNQALKGLQTANPGLKVSYTLPVMPEGLDQNCLDLLSNAKTNGVNLYVVNVMAMDYGTCNIDMGQAAINAANSTRTQLATLGISSKVGITPMVGVNDVSCENFSTANAQTVLNYANANSYIGFIGFWSMDDDASHSYVNIFKAFNGSVAAIPVITARTQSAALPGGQKMGTYDILGRSVATSNSRVSIEKSIVIKGSTYILKIR
jgi:chitinase